MSELSKSRWGLQKDHKISTARCFASLTCVQAHNSQALFE